MGDILVGLYGSDTRTRVLVAGVSGTFLAYAEDANCTPEHGRVQYARAALSAALERAGAAADRVLAFAAGVVGLTSLTGDDHWARPIARDLGPAADVGFVGESKVAHVGAFGGAPGIIALAGTGSSVFAVTDEGRDLFNSDLCDNAQAGERSLGARLITCIAAEEDVAADAPFVQEALSLLGFADAARLRKSLLEREDPDGIFFVGRLVTAWAARGAPLALAICDEGAGELAHGVRLLAPFFRDRPVAVAAVGRVASSPYMQAALGRSLADPPGRFRVAPPLYPPVVGAVLLASQRVGKPLSPDAARQLAARVPGGGAGVG